MAILRQQARFVEQMYDSGMVDEKEVRITLPYQFSMDLAIFMGVESCTKHISFQC